MMSNENKSASCQQSRMMKALRREPTDCTPIWMMRQAGRYMQEYREVREKTSFLDLCQNPSLCAEVMITAVERLDVDAAIIFSDLLPILQPMGMELEFQKGEGPVIHNPVRSLEDCENLRPLDDPQELGFVYETVRLTRAALRPELPLIGFSGAPFTLASYAIEGGASRNYVHVKKMMHGKSGLWDVIMSRLADAVAKYLIEQIKSGADIVQIFDSWAGCLSVSDYARFVKPYSAEAIRRVKEFSPETPVIHFATGNPMLLPEIREAGGDCIGADWRIDLDDAWDLIGRDRSIQGNLDPAVLLGAREEIEASAARVLRQAAGRPGHVFNLGHGILKETPVQNAIDLVKIVRDLSS
ncbi:MAG: uroporphyrinogen decarboxylase [Planctomycetia bacterium]|nr:uroporphyrinogen decarboxylase [Planctomycetia bacterium]